MLGGKVGVGISPERLRGGDEFGIGVTFAKRRATGRGGHRVHVGIVGEAGMGVVVEGGDIRDHVEIVLVELREVGAGIRAGLRPGRDALTLALKRYSAKNATDGGEVNSKFWQDACTGRSLSVEADGRLIIQSVTVSSLLPQDRKCGAKGATNLPVPEWVTGHGLRIGDPQDRVIQLYGEPNTSGPSVHGDRELEFLYYAFDWAGSVVPQVMEIQCARDTGRVVEMTLAFPSL